MVGGRTGATLYVTIYRNDYVVVLNGQFTERGVAFMSTLVATQ